MAAFLTRSANGIKIMLISFKLFFKRPKYILFPLFNILFIAIFFALIFFTIRFTIGFEEFSKFMHKFDKKSVKIVTSKDSAIFISGFLSIVLIYSYVFTFISVATSFFTIKTLEGKSVTILQAIIFGLKKSCKIIKWALITTTFSILISVIDKITGNRGSRFFTFTGGLVWNIVTFFIFPVIAFENLNIFSSIKYSANLFKKTFGESAVAAFGFGIIKLIVYPVAFLGSLFLMFALARFVFMRNIGVVLFMVIPLFILFFSIAIFSTINTIFKTAIYAYCTNRPTGMFPLQLIKSSFVRK